jgi:exopolyphosphatase / guanosine-5'-triphosphate,3'-diphosphate pyrophosphatase
MPALAAIDIGSNALRLAIAKVDASGQYAVVHSGREPVRLGHDVFSTGALSDATIERAIEAFGRFREQIDKYVATSVKAAATSALREASNSGELVRRVLDKTGIEISIIGPEEEARLVHLALRDIVNLRNKVALLIDIGGGSVEVSLATHTGILSTESYQMGSVRLLQILQHQRLGEKRFYQLVSKYVDTIEQRLKRELGNQKLDYCIGTGGSVESIAALRRELLGKNNVSKIRSQELDSAVKTLQAMSVEERVQRLQLRPDRADVIVPAAIVLQKIVHQAGVEEVIVPGASLKDGLILEMVSEQMHPERHLDYDQVISSAMQVGRKYAFDEQHAVAVGNLAVQLFDQTRAIHEMGPDSRTLLEVAAVLHDIGQFVNASNHHKHSFYLLQASSVIGLTPQQMTVVANIARYHRKSLPKPQHKNFEELAPKQRTAVLTLAAILRLANALDREHAGNVTGVELTFKRPKFTMKLKGQGEMLLAKWAVATRCDLFEQVFDGKLVVEGAENA